MVLVKTLVDEKTIPLYMDGGLHSQLNDHVIPSVQKEDFDFVMILDGEEGSGKSVLALQIGKILDPNLKLENICFTADEFIKAVTKAKKNQCVIFDEAFTGLSSRASLSEVNNLVVSLMMEMRQKNLFIIIVMPSVFMLDKYAVFHRAKGLFHVYLSHGKRGYWKFYNRKAMKYLYLTGKKFYEYDKSDNTSFGRFKKQYMVDEREYRIKKGLAFKKKNRFTRAETYKEQRDIMIYALIKEMGKGQRELSRFLAKYDIKLSHVVINEIFHRVNAQFLRSEQ